MTTQQIASKMVFDRWYALLNNCDTAFNSLTNEQLLKEIAPGRNRGIYIMGHLIAVHDDMLPLLNMGDKLFPHLYEPFLKSPDLKSLDGLPSVNELRAMWSRQTEVLTEKFQSLPADEWFEKHNAVSAEDFINEPHCNKLNIVLTRSTHLAYHVGQLNLVKQ